MLGTVLLIGILISGFLHLSPWLLIPATIAFAFVGMHFPPEKALAAKERGIYWRTILYSIPLMAVFVSIIFGIAWALGSFFK